LSGILTFLPRVSITSGNAESVFNPLSISLAVANDGSFDLNDAKLRCETDQMNFEHGNYLKNVGLINDDPDFALGTLAPDGRAVAFCSDERLNIFDGAVNGHLKIVVSFRPSYVPWRTSRTFYLRGIRNSQGVFHWLLTSK
jgi:hypothetical protein